MKPRDWEHKLSIDLPYPTDRQKHNERFIEERIRQKGGPSMKQQRFVWAGVVTAVIAIVLVLNAGTVKQVWGQLFTYFTAKQVSIDVPPGDVKSVNLLLIGPSSDSMFMQTYGRVLMLKHPEWKLQTSVVAWSNQTKDQIIQAIQTNKPDIISLPPSLYKTLIDADQLKELDSWIKRDRFDLAGMHPGAVEPLRQAGGGKLYGLSPTMTSSAMFYNKDLFDEYHIAYPKDGMTWDQVLALAAKFRAAAGNMGDVYGFQPMSEGYGAVDDLARSYGLEPFTKDRTKVQLDTPEWRKVFSDVLDGYAEGTFSHLPTVTSVQDRIKQLPFMRGQAAMTVGISNYVTSNLIPFLSDFARYGLTPFQWGVVSMPENPAAPGINPLEGLFEVYAVSTNAADPDTAWKVVQFINGPEMASAYYHTQMMQMSPDTKYSILLARSNTTIAQDPEHLKPFYALKPGKAEDSLYFASANDPSSIFRQKFRGIATQEMQKAMDGQESLDQLIADLQRQGQQLLDSIGTSATK